MDENKRRKNHLKIDSKQLLMMCAKNAIQRDLVILFILNKSKIRTIQTVQKKRSKVLIGKVYNGSKETDRLDMKIRCKKKKK